MTSPKTGIAHHFGATVGRRAAVGGRRQRAVRTTSGVTPAARGAGKAALTVPRALTRRVQVAARVAVALTRPADRAGAFVVAQDVTRKRRAVFGFAAAGLRKDRLTVVRGITETNTGHWGWKNAQLRLAAAPTSPQRTQSFAAVRSVGSRDATKPTAAAVVTPRRIGRRAGHLRESTLLVFF